MAKMNPIVFINRSMFATVCREAKIIKAIAKKIKIKYKYLLEMVRVFINSTFEGGEYICCKYKKEQ